MQWPTSSEVLIVLPGLTVDSRKREFMYSFFSENTSYMVYVPNIPKRRSLKSCASWLSGYLARIVRPERYQAVHVLAYISGGIVLRHMTIKHPVVHLSRVVYVRSPIQELTLQLVRERYGGLLLWILQGQLMLDIAAANMDEPEYPLPASGHGLVIETGVSRLARSLGISAESVDAGTWDSNRLLPDAKDVIRVPESHDDVYTSPSLLGATQYFFAHGRFQESEKERSLGE
jgi:hypothetical protein